MSKKLQLLLLIVMFSSLANAQFSFHVNNESVDEVQTDAAGSLNIGVHLDQDNSCLGHTIQVALSSSDYGVLDASGCEFPVTFEIPTTVLGDTDEGISLSFSGTNTVTAAPEGPGYILNSLDYTFAEAKGDVTLTLTVLAGSTINGSVLVEDAVLDTLTIHHPSLGDPVDFEAVVHSRSEGMGTVSYEGDLYKDQVVTVTAAPISGYRVKRWIGTDERDPINVQTVTLKRNRQKVTVQFEEIPESEVSRATIKAGRVRGDSKDSFTISGVLGAGANKVPETGGTVSIVIKSDEDDYVLFSQTLSYNDENMKVNWPKNLSYNNRDAADGDVSSFKYDLRRGKFTLTAKNQDLYRATAAYDAEDAMDEPPVWQAPLWLEITIGDYDAALLMQDSGDADVINGRKDIPVQLLTGKRSSLSIPENKERIRVNIDDTLDVNVSGTITTHTDPAEHVLSSFTINDNQDLSISLEKKDNKNYYSYRRPRGSESSVKLAVFDFDKATFKLMLEDADFYDPETQLNFTFVWDE